MNSKKRLQLTTNFEELPGSVNNDVHIDLRQYMGGVYFHGMLNDMLTECSDDQMYLMNWVAFETKEIVVGTKTLEMTVIPEGIYDVTVEGYPHDCIGFIWNAGEFPEYVKRGLILDKRDIDNISVAKHKFEEHSLLL